MKLYRTRTQEEYDWLMQKLEGEGYVWKHTRDKPTEQDYFFRFGDRVIRVDRWDKTITQGLPENYEEYQTIEVSELMKPKTDVEIIRDVIEERNHKPEETYTPPNTGDPWIDNLPEEYFEMHEEEDAIRPQHYRKGEIDLYESWYRTYPFNEFRAGMQMIAERYMKRDKNDRVEDLEKARYTLERLKEYEVQHEAD